MSDGTDHRFRQRIVPKYEESSRLKDQLKKILVVHVVALPAICAAVLGGWVPGVDASALPARWTVANAAAGTLAAVVAWLALPRNNAKLALRAVLLAALVMLSTLAVAVSTLVVAARLGGGFNVASAAVPIGYPVLWMLTLGLQVGLGFYARQLSSMWEPAKKDK